MENAVAILKSDVDTGLVCSPINQHGSQVIDLFAGENVCYYSAVVNCLVEVGMGGKRCHLLRCARRNRKNFPSLLKPNEGLLTDL